MTTELKRMRQLIGSAADWAANDLVIGAGEVAVETQAEGDHRIKIGDGAKRYSELPFASLGLADTTDPAKGDAMVAVKQPFSGAIARTQHDKNAEVISAMDFGAVGDGVTDDAPALNVATAYCTTRQAVLFIPAGTYRIGSTVVIANCHVIAVGAEFRPDATVTYGVDVGSADGVICDSKTIRGLKVRGLGLASHPAGSAAWRFLNATNCTFDNIGGNRMEKGALVKPPPGARIAYSEWRNPYFHRCTRNFDIYVDGTGFAAGNTVWGGRFQLSSVDLAEAHVHAEKTAGSGSMNDWQWYACRMESYAGATVPRWAMRLLRADFWHIVDPRTEGDWADADFEFSANSTDNVIDMLYDNGIKVIDYNGSNIMRFQRTEAAGGFNEGDPATSCIKRFHKDATVRVQILSDGVSLPGLSLGSVASETAVELVWVPTSSSCGVRIGGTLKVEASAGSWRPAPDNTMSCGEAARRWSVVYAGSGTISTSDEREKTDIGPIPDDILDAWAAVEFVSYRWQHAVEAKGDAARVHFGLIAQRVKAVFEQRGIDPFKFGLLCWDQWEGSPALVDPPEYHTSGPLEGQIRREAFESSPAVPAGSRYGIRYDEALALEAALMRREISRLRGA